MFSFLMEKHGEQFNANCHLCPISIKYTENHGEQILKKQCLCPTQLPNPGILSGNFRKDFRKSGGRDILTVEYQKTPRKNECSTFVLILCFDVI
jgi:hypothetical protein